MNLSKNPIIINDTAIQCKTPNTITASISPIIFPTIKVTAVNPNATINNCTPLLMLLFEKLQQMPVIAKKIKHTI